MSELAIPEQPTTTLESQMNYARAVSVAAMLPDTYRGKPADIMLAVGLGQSMGLSPAESLYRISVIKGKPTASAELIAAHVRKAGHRLRVSGDDTTATATIIRADDPDYEFTVTRDLAWAKRMGLAEQPNYKKQPGTMLQWRAITAVARLACPEALYGVSYTPDEMEDIGEQRRSVAPSSLAEQVGATTAEQVTDEPGQPETGEAITDHTRRKLFAMLGERGIDDRDEQIRGINHIIQPDTIESRSELTEAQAQAVIGVLANRPVAQPTLDGGDE